MADVTENKRRAFRQRSRSENKVALWEVATVMMCDYSECPQHSVYGAVTGLGGIGQRFSNGSLHQNSLEGLLTETLSQQVCSRG